MINLEFKLNDNLSVSAEIPFEVIGRVLTGDLVRHGGVLQNRGGEISTWLREACPTPIDPVGIVNSLGPVAANALGFFSGVSSLLNLGATVAYGAKISRELASVESNLSRELAKIESNISKIEWTLDFGFHNLSKQLKDLQRHKEIELSSKVESAAKLAWQAQFLPPDSATRQSRLNGALAQISEAATRLRQLTCSECKIVTRQLSRNMLPTSSNVQKLISVLNRARQTAFSLQLESLILAESGQPGQSGMQLAQQLKEMDSKIVKMCSIFIGGGESPYSESFVLFSLLISARSQDISVSRADRWFRTFNAGAVRQPTAFHWAIKPIKNHVIDRKIHTFHFEKIERNLARNLANALDGYLEDTSRLRGTAAELDRCAKDRITWQEYRERLRIDDFPKTKALAFFCSAPKAQ